MCFTIWAQQAVSTAPAPPNLTRESSLPDRKVLLERIQKVETEQIGLAARQHQDEALVNIQHVVSSVVETKFAEERQVILAEVHDSVDGKLQAERQARHAEREQDASIVSMQIAGVEAAMHAQREQERIAREQGIETERLEREFAINEVQARQDQAVDIIDKQLGSLEAQRAQDAAAVQSLSSRVAMLEKGYYHLHDELQDVLVWISVV